ncbi:TetR/AcrR family transcriptional regulator [Rhodovulum sp. DZ06]|uniref:TetR/AcrR family transcriptional regulator n=1 Tax=Rhodovulum sp. DZ06 TaxID=3425126 RepID=UPI003D3472CF
MARRTGSNGAQTAETLRRAALALFARHGYAAVSMRMIAAEVGVQPGALYNHMGSKQDLLRDLMTAHMEDLLAAQAELPPRDDPAEALAAFTRFHIRFHMGREDAVFISYMELRNLEPENYAAVQALRAQYESRLRAILTRGAETGAFDIADASVAGRAVIAMMTGVTNWFREGGRLSAEDIEQIYIDMTLRAVGAQPRAPIQGG